MIVDPRISTAYATSGASYQQPDGRTSYYTSVPVSSAQYSTPPADPYSDPYYGRGAYNHQLLAQLILYI